jgi:hypothetical protein
MGVGQLADFYVHNGNYEGCMQHNVCGNKKKRSKRRSECRAAARQFSD